MKVTKRIIPLFMVFATIFSMLAVPVHAEGSGMATDASNYWEWISRNYTVAGNIIRSIFDSDVCPKCPDTSGRHNFVERHTTVDGQTGNFYVCEYCGKSAGEVCEDAYNNYVQGIGSIDSSGSFVWTPKVKDLCFNGGYGIRHFPYGQNGGYNEWEGQQTPIDTSKLWVDWSKGCMTCTYDRLDSIWFTFDDVFPCDGYYDLIQETVGYGSAAYRESTYQTRSYFEHGRWYKQWTGYEGQAIPSDSTISLIVNYTPSTSHADSSRIYFKLPRFNVKVMAGSVNSYQPLSVDYRPTSITAPITYTDNTGQINVTTGDVHLFSENDMTLTNPQTGTTSTVTDWSYDYSSRTYDLTLDTGEHSTVTYGDENITIKEGDTTYIYNYYVQPSNDDPNGGGGSNDPAHKHEYTSEVTRQASCTVAGQETLTCSCGDTQTKTIPALGHDWVIKEQVNSEYDENGEETVKGYTIYKCSRCGEEKKSTDGKPPDGGGGGSSLWNKIGELLGTVGGGLLGLIGQLLSSILDALITLAQQIGEKLSRIVELILGWFDEIPLLFGGFLGFLEAVFPFIPADAMLLLTFGTAAVMFIGIIKALRRR